MCVHRCQASRGVFCGACLLARYGEEVAKVAADPHWLCPHCVEETCPDERWICNSSICLKQRGMVPTGVAVYEAHRRGYKSVAHWVQARLKVGAGMS